MKKPIKISESCIWENKYLKVKEKIYMDEKWNKSSFLITSHNKKETIGTFILPITEDGKVIYLEEFRYWPEKIVINFPVWMLDDWVSEIENCKRELLEETWFFSENFKYLGESIIENYFEWKIKYYVALGCKKISKSNLEIWENLEARLCSISEFEKMIINNKVLSSKTCYCFFLAKYKWYL
jgi:ADP-ribose pyrophosphatase